MVAHFFHYLAFVLLCNTVKGIEGSADRFSIPLHIHVKIFRAGEERLTTQLYLKGQTGDGALGALTGTRSQLALELKPGSKDAWRAEFDFILGA